MSITYTPATNFTAKDSMSTANPDKVLSGVPFDAEFSAIQTAFTLAAPASSPTFSGTATFTTIALGSETIVEGDVTNWDATKSTVDAGSANWDTAYGWGDHGAAGYATTTALNTATANSSNWDTAYSWGDHATAGYTTTDTTYSGGTNITLSGTTFNLDASLTGLTNVDTDEVTIGSWEIKLDGSDLRFVYNGTDVFKITTAGALIAADNITAYGAP